MDARLTLRTLRRDHYTCQRRDHAGRKCLAPARFVALRNGEPEARCTAHVEGGAPFNVRNNHPSPYLKGVG